MAKVLELSRRQLSAALSRLKTTAPAKSPKTALRSVRLTFDGSAVELAATDCDRAHSERVATIGQPMGDGDGLTFANCAELAAAVSATKSPTVIVELSADRVYVDGLRLSTPIDAAEFPNVSHHFDADGFEPMGGAIVEVDTVRALLALSIPFVDEDSSRYSLGGVRIETTAGTMGDALRCVATDGRRLSIVTTPGRQPEQWGDADGDGRRVMIEPAFALFPANSAALLGRQLAKTGGAKTVIFELLRRTPKPEPEQPADGSATPPVSAEPSPSSKVFAGADILRVATFDCSGNALSIITTRCIDGRYPNYAQVMPREWQTFDRGAIRTAELAAACRRAATIVDDDTRCAKLSFRERVAILRSKNTGGRAVRDGLRVSGGCPSDIAPTLRATFDVVFLGELAAAATSAGIDALPFACQSATTPGVFGLGELGVFIIMPMGRGENAEQRRAERCRRIDAERERAERVAAELAAA